jgi:hypothetical protein
MTYDLRRYLSEQPKSMDVYRNRNLEEWVESTHSGIVSNALYANFDDNREWVVDSAPVPVLGSQVPDKRIHLELLRRRFVMDGWLRAHIPDDKTEPMSHVMLVLEGPRDPLVVETVDYGTIIPEVNPRETITAAIQRFAQTGVVYYPTIWERVAVPPHGIKKVYQRVAHGDPGGDTL